MGEQQPKSCSVSTTVTYADGIIEYPTPNPWKSTTYFPNIYDIQNQVIINVRNAIVAEYPGYTVSPVNTSKYDSTTDVTTFTVSNGSTKYYYYLSSVVSDYVAPYYNPVTQLTTSELYNTAKSGAPQPSDAVIATIASTETNTY